MDMQEFVKKLQSDPVGMGKDKGYNIPPEMAGDPKAMVQHLIQTGQIPSPMLQRILPMMQRLK